MHPNQLPYRRLYDVLLSGDFEPRSTLPTWLNSHGAEIEWLSAFREAHGVNSSVDDEDLWRLYALSRVFQLLTIPFQKAHTGAGSDRDWFGPAVGIDEWSWFAERLGLAILPPKLFTPFDCEIVAADQGPTEVRISIVETAWPALLLGNMMFLRAGVHVAGGPELLCPSVATSSTMYWAYRRRSRPCHDLSHGWGANSQWRTRFRRDYRVGNRLHFNVGGSLDLSLEQPSPASAAEDELTREQRIELLTHRSFVLTRKPSDDRWPYDDTITLVDRTQLTSKTRARPSG